MNKKKKNQLPFVELLSIPRYRQGEFDSLCTYYTATMLLASLFPEEAWRFGESQRVRSTKRVSEDPLIVNFGGKDNKDHRKILARWFYQGEDVSKVTSILNRLMRQQNRKTRFYCTMESAQNIATYEDIIVGSINDGLPVMLGWSTPDYGDHAVLVTGYWENKEKWLLINDPGTDERQISWDSLQHQVKYRKNSKLEVARCKSNSHNGYRPMKSETENNQTTIRRWSPQGWQHIVD